MNIHNSLRLFLLSNDLPVHNASSELLEYEIGLWKKGIGEISLSKLEKIVVKLRHRFNRRNPPTLADFFNAKQEMEIDIARSQQYQAKQVDISPEQARENQIRLSRLISGAKIGVLGGNGSL